MTVPSDATPGTYRVLMGFFERRDRLAVTPTSAHAGSNRTEAARIQIR